MTIHRHNTHPPTDLKPGRLGRLFDAVARILTLDYYQPPPTPGCPNCRRLAAQLRAERRRRRRDTDPNRDTD